MLVVYAKLELINLCLMKPVNTTEEDVVRQMVPIIDDMPPLFLIGPNPRRKRPYDLIDGCHRRQALLDKGRSEGWAYVITVAQAGQIRRRGEFWDNDLPDYDYHVMITPENVCGPKWTYQQAGLRRFEDHCEGES